MRNSLKTFAMVAALLVAMPVVANAQGVPPKTDIGAMPSGTYKIDPTHASLVWRVNHMGMSWYTARFTRFDATINFRPEDPTKSTLAVTIDPTSIKTDYPNPEKVDFDKELQNDKWLNTAKFPQITFNSTGATKTDATHGTVVGNLSLMGVTKPLTLNVTYNGAFAQQMMTKKPVLGFSATATVKRSDWGFATYVPLIGDDVQVIVEAEFGKAD